ncbi:ATP-binding protein [Ruminococcus sp. HUN007]|uniref:ATP-binding protein n=1 Tax=Ruminococcus sp. HUN007 TaxID=1514668 RepID=UPI0005D1D553|nr:ATP-binding protein [Ruminococcus sp. HUN007]
MKRTAYSRLLKWKEKSGRKPLIINGARQVGKTWLMKDFGRNEFQNVVYINFDNNTVAKQIFEPDYNIPRIISSLKILSETNIDPENTLIIFDEIQECPKALGSLKYFCEDAPEYYVMAAGSLLGIALHKGTSFPVGKTEFMTLYPMTFAEFLEASGNSGLRELISAEDFSTVSPFSEKLKLLLKKYYYVGGMPEAVKTFIDTDDLSKVREIQKDLLLYYENDFSKHAPEDQIPRIQMVWNSIPSQLAKENRKFIYGVVRKGSRAKYFELAIQWLTDYGLINKSIRISKPFMPLIAYMDQSVFKIYMSDVGLLGAKSDLPAVSVIDGNRIFTEYKGALTEQFVAQELRAADFMLYYYSTANSDGEIDFVIQNGDQIIPLEVKAEENLKAKSLRAYCSKYSPEEAIRTSMSAYRKEEWMTNVPLYLLTEYIKKL